MEGGKTISSSSRLPPPSLEEAALSELGGRNPTYEGPLLATKTKGGEKTPLAVAPGNRDVDAPAKSPGTP